MLTGTVAPDATGQLINHVTAQNPPTVADPTPSEATDTDEITPMADLSIVKRGPPVVVPGNNLVYTLEVRNLGPIRRRVDVGVNDSAPAGLTFVSTSGACTTAFPCLLGSIPPDGVPRTITRNLRRAARLRDAESDRQHCGRHERDTGSRTRSTTPRRCRLRSTPSADVAVTKSVSPATATRWATR